jgi:O-antigen/teichoic acid export membrane protein
MMRSRGEYKALDQLLYRIIAVALGVLLLGGLAVWLLVYSLNILNHPFAARLLPPLPMALILLGIAVASALSPASVYLRAHKKEPYVLISIVSGFLIGLSSLILGKQFSAMGVAVAYLGSNLILLPWGLAIFYHCRREWHAVV